MKMKKKNGITLIALIITIIILLILVGVSVNLLIKGDLFGSAEKAVTGTNDKVAQEQTRVDELMNELDNVQQQQCDHTWGAWQIINQPTCTVDGTGKRTCTKCGKIETKVIKAGHQFESGTCKSCGTELVIGANIDYHEYIGENGNTITASYTSTKETRGSTDSSDADATYSVVNNSGIQWIILGVENGQVKITTKSLVDPTNGGYADGNYKYLVMEGKNGYTNFVDELNNIGAIYGKGKGADTTKFSESGGRSFKMEDLGYSALTRTTEGTHTYTSGKTFNYMELDASTSTTEGQHTWKSLSSTNSSVTIYNYTYEGSNTLTDTVSKVSNFNYYLASRHLFTTSDVLYLCVLSTGYYGAGYRAIWSSNGSDGTITVKNARVRPVVYLQPDIYLSYDATNGYGIN